MEPENITKDNFCNSKNNYKICYLIVRDKQMIKTLGPSAEQLDVIMCFSLFKVVSVFMPRANTPNTDSSREWTNSI